VAAFGTLGKPSRNDRTALGTLLGWLFGDNYASALATIRLPFR
jgi:hypothetical protein